MNKKRLLTLMGGKKQNPWYLANGLISAANCVAAYQPKGATSLAASYINLANPGTYNAAPGTAPDWDAVNGWKSNGATHYLRTGITPNSNNWTYIIQHTNATNGVPIGYVINSGGFFYTQLIPIIGTNRYYGNGNATIIQKTGAGAAAGFLAVSDRTCYTGITADGTLDAADSPSFDEIYLCARKLGASPNNFYAGYLQYVAIYNTALSLAQITAIYNNLNP